MALQFSLETYQKAQLDLQLSKINAEVLQKQFETFLNSKQLSADEKEWILSHRDYLSSLEVALTTEMVPLTATMKPVSETSELLRNWQALLSDQLTILGKIFQEVQCITEGKFVGEVPLTDGESRRLLASIKDIMDSNRWEQKDLREYKNTFLQLYLSNNQESIPEEKTEKKGFFARLFGK